MSSIKDFFNRYNNKDVVPTLEAMQKIIAFYQDKNIDMLKLGCTLPNLANICLHKSTDAKFYPITEGDKDLLEKIREDVVGGPSIVFTRKAVFDEIYIRKSKDLCKSFVGIDASRLYPYSMCQPMPTVLYTLWDLDSETSRFTPRQNKTRSFEIMVRYIFHSTSLDCKIETKKCFDRFVQLAVDAGKQGYENPNSGVAAETLKLLVNSSYGYQVMDRSRHTVMKYRPDEKNSRGY